MESASTSRDDGAGHHADRRGLGSVLCFYSNRIDGRGRWPGRRGTVEVLGWAGDRGCIIRLRRLPGRNRRFFMAILHYPRGQSRRGDRKEPLRLRELRAAAAHLDYPSSLCLPAHYVQASGRSKFYSSGKYNGVRLSLFTDPTLADLARAGDGATENCQRVPQGVAPVAGSCVG